MIGDQFADVAPVHGSSIGSSDKRLDGEMEETSLLGGIRRSSSSGTFRKSCERERDLFLLFIDW